jgi:hypothetical protein
LQWSLQNWFWFHHWMLANTWTRSDGVIQAGSFSEMVPALMRAEDPDDLNVSSGCVVVGVRGKLVHNHVARNGPLSNPIMIANWPLAWPSLQFLDRGLDAAKPVQSGLTSCGFRFIRPPVPT